MSVTRLALTLLESNALLVDTRLRQVQAGMSEAIQLLLCHLNANAWVAWKPTTMSVKV